MASFFIDRPVFAAVISIILVLAGAVAMNATPVAQYPDIAPPTVQVSTTYPGATAEVIANTVAAPIEQQVNGVDRMTYMSSTSSSTGNMTLTVTFEPGTDPDMAQVNVQNRVNQASPKLPSVVSPAGGHRREAFQRLHDGHQPLLPRQPLRPDLPVELRQPLSP